ncbi:glycoside hydrolase family 16 protein [Boletus reticuloceps]|uniref:Glycoside hydrolase family 16 protein n=1 Tax=Boletus reticuloceps TaxID=495285 RepID=A0A8I2Z0H9_9AGAM|nr:glycoside hydrolase family 16 protein [Boletus reticuloceps]
MKFPAATCGLVLPFFARSVLAGATYSLSDSIVGEGFYNAFNFEAIPDPTNGRVNYVDQATAQSLNLTYATSNTFIMRADDTTVLSSSGPGRNSVRIRTNNQYTTHVAVYVCKTAYCRIQLARWRTLVRYNVRSPALTVLQGEVDIVEGVNNVEPNQSTLHTSPSQCVVPESLLPVKHDLLLLVNGNAGCGVKLTEDYNSFGPGFNNIGGGWYAIERTNNYISIWFWERGDASAPSDATSGAATIDTSNWGTPAAYFPNTDCDLATHFAANGIIINLTFCECS